MSDRCFKGEREDESGKIINERLEKKGYTVIDYRIVPDDKNLICKTILELVDKKVDLIITTGGTGLSPRDVTPEATKEIVDREIPGIAELLRFEGCKKTVFASLSRGIAGIKGNTLIINLPGSPKAVEEGLDIVLTIIPHAIETMRGLSTYNHRKIWVNVDKSR